MARIASGKRMELLSMKRYELPGPAPNRLTDVTAWAEAVDNSYSQLEHQVGDTDSFPSLQRRSHSFLLMHWCRLSAPHQLSHANRVERERET